MAIHSTLLCLAESGLQLLRCGDIDEGDHGALNDVGYGAVRHDAHLEPMRIARRYLLFAEREGAQSVLRIRVEFRIVQRRGEVAEWTPDIGIPQIDDAFDLL